MYPNKPYQRGGFKSGASLGLEKKQEFIKKSVDRKEKSMQEFAIRRDSAMFATVSAGVGASRESLEKEYAYWTEFFGNVYAEKQEEIEPPKPRNDMRWETKEPIIQID